MQQHKLNNTDTRVSDLNFTVITDSKPINKLFTLDKSGGIEKVSRATIGQATAQALTIQTPEQFAELLTLVSESPNAVLMTGTFNNWTEKTPEGKDNDFKLTLVTEKQLARITGKSVAGGVVLHDGQYYAARVKRGISPSVWVLLDFDEPNGFWVEHQGKTIQEKLELLEPYFPNISKCLRIEARSSSARVVVDGVIKPKSHAWIQVSDPAMIELFKVNLEVSSGLNGLIFYSPRYSKETGEKLAGKGNARYLVDTCTLTTGRIVFTNVPELDPHLTNCSLIDAGIEIVNPEGGVFDISQMELPKTAPLRALMEKTGQDIKFSTNGTSLVIEERGLLNFDTEIEVNGEFKSLGYWLSEMKSKGLDKLRCEAPFRESKSEAAFIRIPESSAPYVFDSGTGTKYPLESGSIVTNDSASSEMAKNDNPYARFETVILPSSFPLTKVREKSIQVIDHVVNAEHLFKALAMTVSYCHIRKKNIFTLNGAELSGGDNFDEGMLTYIESFMRLNGMQSKYAGGYINAIAAKNPINPIVDYLSALKWDGENWIERLVATLDVDSQEHAYRMFKVWLKQACAAADGGAIGIAKRKVSGRLAQPRFSYVLLALGEQGVNKSSGFELLLPEPLRKFFGGGINLDLKNKDSLIKVLAYWLAELGELDATFSKSEISALKAFLSDDKDVIRMPYARTPSRMQRRTAFCGTANDDAVLRDKTGNRRYLPFYTGNMLHTLTPEQLDQVWAQAWALYEAGEAWWPEGPDLELFKERAEVSTEIDPYQEVLTKLFNWDFDAQAIDGVATYEGRYLASEIFAYIELIKRDQKLYGAINPPTIENARKQGQLTNLPSTTARNYGYALKKLWAMSGAVTINGQQKINCLNQGLILTNGSGKNPGWKLPK